MLILDCCFQQLILNAKCHAIRDAQLLEKSQIQGELVDGEKRLDIMMEVRFSYNFSLLFLSR